jgi:dienelactone hydrolase
VLAALKADGVTSVGAVGYCYGARWVFDLAFDNAITVAAVAHPSLLQVPADLEVSFSIIFLPADVRADASTRNTSRPLKPRFSSTVAR